MTDDPNTPNEPSPPLPPGQPSSGVPPAGQPAPGQPPPGQQPAGQQPVTDWSTGSFDADATKAAFKGANRSDLVIIAAGVLAFILSVFPYYTALGGSETAWHGFWGWFAALVALAGSIVLALPLLGVRAALPTRLVVLVCFGVATLCVLIAGFTWPGKGGCGGNSLCEKVFDSSTGHGFGYWASLLVIVVGLVFAAFRYLNKPIPGMPV